MINEQVLEKCLGHKKFFSPKDLLNMGLFGSKSQILNYMNKGLLPSTYVTDRRRVVVKDDLLNFLIKCNNK